MHSSQTLTVSVCWLLAVIIPPGGVVGTIRHHRAVERNDIGVLSSSSSSSSSSSMTADDCRLTYDIGASNELVCAPADFALGKRMNATQTAPGECIFCFHREPGQVLLSFEGEVVSPNHPGLYPRSTSCIYAFLASPGELVRLRFTQFNVEGIYPCLNWTQSDYVELSNNIRQTDRKYPRLCGNQRPHEEKECIVSKSNFFRLTLVSNAIYDSTGFSAHYDFINKSVAHPEDDGHVKTAKHLCDIAL
ncbi:PREDICTED: suppressor of lurcher protein 1-like [Priapulus caudatus]|uniref:Suppressor of lurcher protein 1-like n=1 Tax=Priapulus caudatus TaxID=37621 RepID=A0ABM1EPJ2_PRICU|nr:PREDICTED: suppressor of lurcher protein 1-like [Priapulus caudatus]